MNIQNDCGSSQRISAWTAIAHVMPLNAESLPEGASGAFVNVVGFTSSSSDFQSQLKELIAGLGFELVEIDDLDLISERQSKQALTDELLELVRLAEFTGEFAVGTFYTYDEADDLM